MFPLLRNTFFFCFLCIAINGHSQHTTYSKSYPDFIEFYYIDDHKESSHNTNHIIKTLAAGKNKEITATSFKFFYTITTQLHLSENGIREGFISFKGFVITGDVKYKNFSVVDVLIPSEARAIINFPNKTKNKNENIDISNIGVLFSDTKACYSIDDTVLRPDPDIKLSVEAFYYNDEAKGLFDRKILAIETYYNSDSIINSLEKKLESIDPEKLDLIPMYNIWIDEITETTDELIQLDLVNELQLELSDPLDFVSKLNSLKQRIDILHARLKSDFLQMEIIYCEKAKELIEQYQTEEAEKYLERSLQFNTRYIPAHYEIAKLYLSNKNPDDAVETLNKVHQEMEIKERELLLLTELGDNIVQHYLKIAEGYILQNNDNDALGAISKAEQFCSAIPWLDCPKEISDLKARAKYGIFKSYLQIANKAMEIQSFNFAEEYIKKASEYQHNNEDAVSSDAEIRNLYGHLIYNCTEKGYEALVVPDFNNAQVHFDHAYRLCTSLDGFKCSQRLLNGINSANNGIAMEYNSREIVENNEVSSNTTESSDESTIQPIDKYDQNDHGQLIAEAEILIEAKQGVDAFEKLTTARMLEQKFNITPYANMDELISLSAKPVILRNLKESDYLIWQNKLEEAVDVYNKAVEDQKKFKLSEDTDINTALTRLQKKRAKKKCFNAESEYNNHCKKALSYLRRGEVNNASRYLIKADNIKNSNSLCSFIEENTNNIRRDYSDYFNYQKNMDMARAQSREKSYESAIDHYQKSYKSFLNGELDTTEIVFPNPYEFTFSYDDADFSLYVCKYLLDKEDHANSFLLLKDLRRLNFPSKGTKETQLKLGEALAKADKKKDNDPVKKIEEYTLGDKWYQQFRKAYLSVWNN